MNGKLYISLVVLALSLSLVTCGSTPENQNPSDSSPQSQPKKGSYYEGDGGKGISIAILAPKATGLSKEQEYIPSLIQGELVSNFTGYSAISVLDRQRLDEQYAELLSGYYDDNAPAGTDLGHLNPTGFLMTGTVTKTATGYAMQIGITNNTDKMTAASYSGTFTFAELDNLSGVRQASLDLLQKMGVIPTESARAELAKAATDNHVNAQTSLAQGIVAQRGGTVVEAMGYFSNAAFFDPKLSEANGRFSTLSSNISSGNIGTNVRNDIQRRKEWEKILGDAETYFSKHLPFEIVYDAALVQGAVDYQKETVNLSTFVSLDASKDGLKLFEPLLKGLESTGQRQEWGFGFWPLASKVFSDFWETPDTDKFTHAKESVDLEIGLFNDRGACVSKADINLSGQVHFALGRKIQRDDRWKYGGRGYYIVKMGDTYAIDTTKLEFDARVSDWSMASWDGKGKLPGGELVLFLDVDANDITDTMTVKIISVNGIDAERAVRDGYIRITTGAITPRGWAEVFKSF